MRVKNYYYSLLLASAALIVLSGCTPKNPLPANKHYSSSLIDLPFIPPRSELCASTSIEMVSLYWQSKTSYAPLLSAKELDKRTLIPAKGGTLQVELVAAARASGLLVYPLEPTLDALIPELNAQHPVIVLVNRSYAWYPLWHYAPINGYDAKEETVLSHFNDLANEMIPIGTFAALWERSGNWAVVLLPPGHLPASATVKTFLHAASDLEKTGRVEEAKTAYRSALVRWPNNGDLLFALANSHYRLNNLIEAEAHYRKLLALDPTNPLALNNLADLLCRTGRPEEALRVLEKAVTDDKEIESIINTTKEEIGAGCRPLSKQ